MQKCFTWHVLAASCLYIDFAKVKIVLCNLTLKSSLYMVKSVFGIFFESTYIMIRIKNCCLDAAVPSVTLRSLSFSVQIYFKEFFLRFK